MKKTKETIEEKITKYEAEHKKAIEEIQRMNSIAIRLEGAILAMKELIEEDKND